MDPTTTQNFIALVQNLEAVGARANQEVRTEIDRTIAAYQSYVNTTQQVMNEQSARIAALEARVIQQESEKNQLIGTHNAALNATVYAAEQQKNALLAAKQTECEELHRQQLSLINSKLVELKSHRHYQDYNVTVPIEDPVMMQFYPKYVRQSQQIQEICNLCSKTLN